MAENTALPQLTGVIAFLEEMQKREGEDAKVHCSTMEKVLKQVVEELERK